MHKWPVALGCVFGFCAVSIHNQLAIGRLVERFGTRIPRLDLLIAYFAATTAIVHTVLWLTYSMLVSIALRLLCDGERPLGTGHVSRLTALAHIPLLLRALFVSFVLVSWSATWTEIEYRQWLSVIGVSRTAAYLAGALWLAALLTDYVNVKKSVLAALVPLGIVVLALLVAG